MPVTTRTTYSRSRRLRDVAGGLSVAIALSVTLTVTAGAVAPAPARSADGEPPVGEVQEMAQAATEAAATGEEVAVPSLTTETNEVVAQPGGTFKLEAHREPVRTDINGDWEPIDTSLEVAADGSISPRAITIAVEFGAGGSNEMVTAGAGDHSIAFTWDDGTLPDPVVSGSEVTYPAYALTSTWSSPRIPTASPMLSWSRRPPPPRRSMPTQPRSPAPPQVSTCR